VERYYKEHGKEYAEAEQVRVRHIFLPLSAQGSVESDREVEAQAQDIRKRALAGEDFGKLADEYSRGPGAGQGGDIGYFKKGQMAKEIEDVAFSLKPGEISQPFRSGIGVHLIKVEEHTQPGQQELSKEAAEEIKRQLYNEALKQRYERWFQEDLRFRHNIENLLTASSGGSTNRFLKKTSDANRAASAETQAEEKKGFLRSLWPF
ncbi:MAG: peptidylprolyl isomerase, partial [Candidatus Binatia bacterium]